MKRGFIPILVILLIGCDSKTKKVGVTNLSTFQDTTSYVLGADLGENLRRQNVGLDYDVFMAGLTDGYETGVVQLDKNQRRNAMMALQKHIKEKAQEEGKNNLAAADEFLDKNKNENLDVKETPTGLQYRVLKEGEGNSPGKTDRVKVHYAGRLIDGTEFDSSIKREEPSSFGLNQVIKGWTEGLQLMKVGSKFEFFIHPKIAYGTRPKPNIPSNSLLIFEVELLEIEEKK
jgi:FKBP-type peptidyl-prolyl cis-trans isomerase